jgi:hypothetical protein
MVGEGLFRGLKQSELFGKVLTLAPKFGFELFDPSCQIPLDGSLGVQILSQPVAVSGQLPDLLVPLCGQGFKPGPRCRLCLNAIKIRPKRHQFRCLPGFVRTQLLKLCLGLGAALAKSQPEANKKNGHGNKS